MKKITVILSTLLISGSMIFAGDFKPELHTTPSVRQQGYGGFYTTDVEGFYSMYSNPASLGKRRVHSLFPGLDVHVGGPLKDIPEIISGVSNMDTDKLTKVISDNNGLKLDVDVQPLLSFGHTSSWGFGWGFTTQAFMNATVPGMALADIQGGAEAVLTLGFAFPIINSDNFLLTVGATAKGFGQGATAYNGNLVTFISKMKDDPTSLPLYLSAGFTFDAGVYLSICNTINVGVVYNNPFSKAWVAKGTIGKPSYDFKDATKLDQQLSAGVSYNVPVAWTNGVITSFRIMGDYRNIFGMFQNGSRNPWLEVSCGTEIVFGNICSLRFGIQEMLPACGLGFKLGTFNIDMAVYGKELGLEPGSSPVMNGSVFIGFTY